MARSVSITRPHKHRPRHKDAFEEQRPVLQLPLERPVWREPVNHDDDRVERERGVAVIDFFI